MEERPITERLAERSGVILHGYFMEDSDGVDAFNVDPNSPLNDGLHRVYRAVSEPLRFRGDDVRRIMDGDLELVSAARVSRPWFPENEFGLFFDAWVAVPIRLRSARRRLDEYVEDAPVEIGEETLFGFFTNAVAVIDSFCFALFAMASMLQPRNFPTATDRDRRRVKIESTQQGFAKFFGATPIARALPRAVGSGEFAAIAAVRNVLAHRASPVFATGDEGAKPTWITRGHLGRDVEFSRDVLAGETHWLDETVATLLEATTTFAESQWEYRRRREIRPPADRRRG